MLSTTSEHSGLLPPLYNTAIARPFTVLAVHNFGMSSLFPPQTPNPVFRYFDRHLILSCFLLLLSTAGSCHRLHCPSQSWLYVAGYSSTQRWIYVTLFTTRRAVLSQIVVVDRRFTDKEQQIVHPSARPFAQLAADAAAAAAAAVNIAAILQWIPISNDSNNRPPLHRGRCTMTDGVYLSRRRNGGTGETVGGWSGTRNSRRKMMAKKLWRRGRVFE